MKEPAQATTAAKSSTKRGNILSIIVILLAFGIIGSVISAINNTPSCPDELIGSWTTTAQGYEDKVLLITRKGIAFSTGENELEGLAVRGIQANPDESGVFYTITYGASRSEEQVLSFQYHPRTQTITFNNQPLLVWARKTMES